MAIVLQAGLDAPVLAQALPAAPTNLTAAAISTSQINLAWSDNSTNEAGFKIEQSVDDVAFSLIATVSANENTHAATDLGPALKYYFRVRASNAAGDSTNSSTASSTTRTPLAHWQNMKFTPSQLTNPAISGLAADPDGDRLRNLAEYALNREPLAADATNLARATLEQVPADGPAYLSVTYSRSRTAIDVAFVPAVSDDLAVWQSGSNLVTGPIVVSTNGETVAERFRDNLPINSVSQKFMRLSVAYTGVLNSWETGPMLPVTMDEVACGVIDNVLYVVGGSTVGTMAFHLAAGSWTNPAALAARPFPGNHHAAEVFNGKLYLFGGLGGSSGGRTQIFDPANNAWSLGALMPFAAGSSSSALIAGQIYVAGGSVGSVTTNGLARYDAVSNSWVLLAPMPQPRNHAASATDGSRFYIFGGRGPGDSGANGANYVQLYDPANNTWTSSAMPGSLLAPLPQARGGMGKAVYYAGEFYVIGGETTSGAGATALRVYNRVDIYNPTANSWRLGTPMPTARHGIFPVLAGRRIHVAGGGIAAGGGALGSSRILESYILP